MKTRAGKLLEKLAVCEASKKKIGEMTPHELVEFMKTEQWSESPEKMKEAIEVMERMCEEMEDEEVKMMAEYMDDASSKFDIEEMKKSKK